jgi:hypothetical protein
MSFKTAFQVSTGLFLVRSWPKRNNKKKPVIFFKPFLPSSNNFPGYYLYVAYEAGQNGFPGYGATLRSPVFPPPPAYNNINNSAYYKSCRVSRTPAIWFCLVKIA